MSNNFKLYPTHFSGGGEASLRPPSYGPVV